MTTADQPTKPPSADTLRRAAIAMQTRDAYLTSRDFNGLPLRMLANVPTLREDVRLLIAERLVDLVRGDRHENPHIKALTADPVDEQLRKLDEQGLGHGCLYPTPELLSRHVNPADYDGRPYALVLALGGSQLDFRPFDMVSLEFYRNDPRYYYNVDDIQGSIVYDDKFLATGVDPLVLGRFGFCHSQPDLRRAVAVLLRDLSKLKPAQQQHWRRHELSGEFRLHPGFEAAIHGSWNLGHSIFDAFLEEKNQINVISRLMGREPLFRSDMPKGRPPGFGFLIRPTQRELHAFVLQLHQFLGDDINPDFFRELDKHIRGTSEDGKPMVQPKGSITLLKDWLAQAVKLADSSVATDIINSMRHIAKLRSKPAHTHQKDAFDARFLDEQRELILEAYAAVHNLRLVFQLHPTARAHEVPAWLDSDDIWTR